jgi:nitroreductase
MTETMGGSMDLVRHAEEIVRAAARAPSHHNAQPWAFRVTPGTVEVWADRSRRMPVADPADRQLLLGVGAAVYGVRLALASLSVRPRVRLLPDRREQDLAAVVEAGGVGARTEEEAHLYPELGRRRTVRGPFTDDPLPVPLQVTLADAADAEGAALRWVEAPGERRGLAALAITAEREQQADPAFRAELARWVGAPEGGRAGIPIAAVGPTAGAGHAAEFPLRDFTGGRRDMAGWDERPEAHPAVVALTTPGEGPMDWLRAGQALHRLLLAASAAGVSASFLNQPLEIDRLRAQVREELRLDNYPQLILRLGRPAGPPRALTPRRPLAEILRH